MPTPRALRRLARACGVAVAAGPGCFLFFPCDSSVTHPETIAAAIAPLFARRPASVPAPVWHAVIAPAARATGFAAA